MNKHTHEDGTPFTKEEFLKKLETDNEFNIEFGNKGIDQISDLIKQLKENPDSRRLIVNAWAVDDLSEMVLPPCHYGFQVYTRELSLEELNILYNKRRGVGEIDAKYSIGTITAKDASIPKRAISLIWNQRSVDTFLGLPFNIASYGLLLSIIAEIVNMVPDELIGNLGDTHLYVDHLDAVKEQIGRELTKEERIEMYYKEYADELRRVNDDWIEAKLRAREIPTNSREPFPLPTLRINSEFWLTKTGECGIGEFTDDIDSLIKSMNIDDFQIENYKSHPSIKAKLLN
jgi:thymidylate synthase